jgi:hypothetical protein
MSACKCPRDKLACIKRCVLAIHDVLQGHSRRGLASSEKVLMGTDDLLPLMILTVKTCNPVRIHSELKYLQRYTKNLQSEAGYLLTNLVSAVFFLDNVDAKALAIDPEVYEQAMRESKAVAQRNTQFLIEKNQQDWHNKNKKSTKHVSKNRDASRKTITNSQSLDENGSNVFIRSEFTDNCFQYLNNMDNSNCDENCGIDDDDDQLLRNYLKKMKILKKTDFISVNDIRSKLATQPKKN